MPGHQVTVEWMGKPVTTLADLFPSPCRAVVVGINPATPSVEAGHYYQGGIGQRVLSRLRTGGLVPSDHPGYEDDAAMERGVGFTDIIKRPTASAHEVDRREYAYGREFLRAKLARLGSPLVVFVFPVVAKRYFGVRSSPGFGFVDRLVGDSTVFVMPGPYASRADGTVDAAFGDLSRWVKAIHQR